MPINPVKLVQILDCAKPLIFRNEDRDFPYSIQGTCFLARFGGRIYAITAKHCLRNRGLDSVLIRLHPGDLTFLPISSVHLPHTTKGIDEDFLDLALFRLEPATVSASNFSRTDAFDLEGYDSQKFKLRHSAIFALIGFPSEVNTIDYEEHVINTRGFTADGHYAGPAESNHCSRILFNNLGSLNDLDGLSGSPVFQFSPRGENIYTHSLAGLLIRGSKVANEGRFIETPVLLRALEFIKQNQ